GNTKFRGTAYFKDIEKVSISSGSNGTDLNIDFETQPYGTIILELKNKKEKAGTETPALTDEQVAQMVAMAKTQYSQYRPMMESFLGGLKVEIIFNLPGTIQAVSNFEKIDDNTAGIAVEGTKILTAMDEMMLDDKLLAGEIRKGKNPLKDGPDEVIGEKLLGWKGPVRIVISDTKPLFDYDSEVAAAKADYADILRRLDLDSTIPPAVEEETEIVAPAAAAEVPAAVPDYEKPIVAQLRDGFKRELSGDIDGALKIYLGIIANEKAENKDLARTYHRIGLCYLKKNDEDKAIETFVHIITYFPNQRGPVLKAKKELKKLERRVPKKKSSGEKKVDFAGTELFNDAGPEEKGSSFVIVDGHIVKFEALPADKYLTGIRVYATRPLNDRTGAKEDLKIFLLDDDFQIIDEFTFPLKKFDRNLPKWVRLDIDPKELPSKFAICLDSSGGLAVGADAENSGSSFFGLPGGDIYLCNSNGDWLIRAVVSDSVTAQNRK
ncbi:MAG: hypothetical protein GWO86_01670, partial [Planctomycetes bacterium]|nr:hypothetical protein [Planctomycetota bacterium]